MVPERYVKDTVVIKRYQSYLKNTEVISKSLKLPKILTLKMYV